jgi:hypothetical protein
MNIINFNPNLFDLHIDESMDLFNDFNEGYVYQDSTISLPTLEFLKSLQKIIHEFGEVDEFDYSSNDKISKTYVSKGNFKLRVYGDEFSLTGCIAATTEEIRNNLYRELYRELPDIDGVCVFSTSYYNDGNSLETMVERFDDKILSNVSKSYYPYINTNLLFDQFFTSNENILILAGAPGLGKSKLTTLALKYAQKNINKSPQGHDEFISVGIVKSVDILSQDKFWVELEKNSHDFVIIDDLDYMLTKRDAEIVTTEDVIKNSFLNQFLSFTDGITHNNVKFIITTNQNLSELDPAILRKGRLFDILELRPLKNEEALSIWKEHGLPKAKFKYKGDVNPADLGSSISKLLNKRIDEPTAEYLLEDNISKIRGAGRSRKISL